MGREARINLYPLRPLKRCLMLRTTVNPCVSSSCPSASHSGGGGGGKGSSAEGWRKGHCRTPSESWAPFFLHHLPMFRRSPEVAVHVGLNRWLWLLHKEISLCIPNPNFVGLLP